MAKCIKMKKLRSPDFSKGDLSGRERQFVRTEVRAVNHLVAFYNEWVNNDDSSPTGRDIVGVIDKVCKTLELEKPEIID